MCKTSDDYVDYFYSCLLKYTGNICLRSMKDDDLWSMMSLICNRLIV